MSMLNSMKTIKCGVGRTKKISEEHDINKLINRYKKTGILPATNQREGMFVDVSQMGDFFESQNELKVRIMEHFSQLPSNVRRKFNGDPEEFVRYCQELTKEQEAEAKELGIIVEPEKPAEPAAAPAKEGVK